FVADFIGVSNIIAAEVINSAASSAQLCIGNSCLNISVSTPPRAGKIKIAVRPEKIEMARTPVGAVIEGTIVERVYFGSSTHWRVKLDDSSELIVAEQNRNANGESYQIVEKVYLRWDEESTIILNG